MLGALSETRSPPWRCRVLWSWPGEPRSSLRPDGEAKVSPFRIPWIRYEFHHRFLLVSSCRRLKIKAKHSRVVQNQGVVVSCFFLFFSLGTSLGPLWALCGRLSASLKVPWAPLKVPWATFGDKMASPGHLQPPKWIPRSTLGSQAAPKATKRHPKTPKDFKKISERHPNATQKLPKTLKNPC